MVIQAPAGMGGIVRYFEDYKSKFEITPDKVVFLTIVVIVIILLLHALNPFNF